MTADAFAAAPVAAPTASAVPTPPDKPRINRTRLALLIALTLLVALAVGGVFLFTGIADASAVGGCGGG